ncbi:MAG: glutamyl-tRNA reductase, partial [Thalassolituus sp.]
MSIWALGINHKTAPVAVRERVAFDPASMPSVLKKLQELDSVSEVVVLSTCNRTEIYLTADDHCPDLISHWLEQNQQIGRVDLDASMYYLSEDQAVSHT